jgi:hypothetical protein
MRRRCYLAATMDSIDRVRVELAKWSGAAASLVSGRSSDMWRLKQSRLSSRFRTLVTQGLQRLEELTTCRYSLPRSRWLRRSTIVECNGLILVLIRSAGWMLPRQNLLIGINPVSGRVLLPTECSKDLLEVARAAGIPSAKIGQAIALMRWDAGVVQRNFEPILVNSPDLARTLEIEHAYRSVVEIYPEREIWWHRWYGSLNALSIVKEKIAYDLCDDLVGRPLTTWKVQELELEPRLLTLAVQGVSRLNKLTGERYSIQTSERRRSATVMKCNGLLLLRAVAGICPLRYRLIGIEPTSARILLPSEFSGDLLEVAEALMIPKHRMGTACACVHWDPGLVRKGLEPILVDSLEVARTLGIANSYLKAVDIHPRKELWWQRWSGFLHALNLEGQRLTYELADLCEGSFDRYKVLANWDWLSAPDQ